MANKKAPTIARDVAIRAALDAIDEVGLDAFNLAMVAQSLGVRTPSLYYHFKDKSEVLAEVARRVLLDADEELEPNATDWKEALIAASCAVRRSILRHPNAAPLLLIYPPRHIAIGGYERTMKFLERHQVPVEFHMRIVAGLDAISWGATLFEAMARSRGFQLYPVYDPTLFPNLARANKVATYDDDLIFASTMRSFLEGLNIPETAAKATGKAARG